MTDKPSLPTIKEIPPTNDNLLSPRSRSRRRKRQYVNRTSVAKEKFDSNENYIVELKAGQWAVHSFKNPDTYYEVHVTGWGGWTCTCKDHEYRNVNCKHIKLVQLEQDNKNTPHFSE